MMIEKLKFGLSIKASGRDTDVQLQDTDMGLRMIVAASTTQRATSAKTTIQRLHVDQTQSAPSLSQKQRTLVLVFTYRILESGV